MFTVQVWKTELLSQYDSFTWKMVLKRPFIGDTGGARVLQVDMIALIGLWA